MKLSNKNKLELKTFAESVAESLEAVAEKINAIESILNGEAQPDEVVTDDTTDEEIVDDEDDEVVVDDVPVDEDEDVVDDEDIEDTEDEETVDDEVAEEPVTEDFSEKSVKATKTKTPAAKVLNNRIDFAVKTTKEADDRYQKVKDFLSGAL